MARYNSWQNENLIIVAGDLSDDERQLERGAFFGSIQGTFSHLLWADIMWLSRLCGTVGPSVGLMESANLYSDWNAFKTARHIIDARIEVWAREVSDAWLKSDLSWFSGSMKAEVSRPAWIVITHFFNHQTHHRGQIHTLLTQLGAKPRETDFFILPAQ
jgi:uncharacterized damage-inducible protein DinB